MEQNRASILEPYIAVIDSYLRERIPIEGFMDRYMERYDHDDERELLDPVVDQPLYQLFLQLAVFSGAEVPEDGFTIDEPELRASANSIVAELRALAIET